LHAAGARFALAQGSWTLSADGSLLKGTAFKNAEFLLEFNPESAYDEVVPACNVRSRPGLKVRF
jgi:hypothetical protein